MSLHGEEDDKQDVVREFCVARDSLVNDFYHRRAEGSFYTAWFA
jgi:hypothetical protein